MKVRLSWKVSRELRTELQKMLTSCFEGLVFDNESVTLNGIHEELQSHEERSGRSSSGDTYFGEIADCLYEIHERYDIPEYLRDEIKGYLDADGWEVSGLSNKLIFVDGDSLHKKLSDDLKRELANSGISNTSYDQCETIHDFWDINETIFDAYGDLICADDMSLKEKTFKHLVDSLESIKLKREDLTQECDARINDLRELAKENENSIVINEIQR